MAADSDTTAPWPREKLDLHVTQGIREYADIAYRWQMHNGEIEIFLREDCEHRMWERIQKALADAGWEIRHAGF